MNLRYWLNFFIPVLICLLTVFFTGFFLTKIQSIRFEQSSIKKSINLEGLLYLEHINKKLDFLIKEGEDIQNEGRISSDSPFSALVVFRPSQREKVYLSEDSLLLSVIQDQVKSSVMGQAETESTSQSKKEVEAIKKHSSSELKEEKNLVKAIPSFELERKALIYLSRKVIAESSVKDFMFKEFKVAGKKQNFIIFIKSLVEGGQWLAFLKKDTSFFKIESVFLNTQERDNRDVFVVNSQGRLFFHNKTSGLFKVLAKKSPVRKFLKDITIKSKNSSYLKSYKKKGNQRIYFLHKWSEGDLFLIFKSDYSNLFFNLEDFYFPILMACLLVFCFVFAFFCLNFFRLAFAYRFLKQAILSFDKTDLFPVTDVPKNPLLYFYSNRRLFLNKRKEDKQDEKDESASLNLQSVVRQEVEKLKHRFPSLKVNENFNFDVKLFGFERFFRAVIYEVLVNALEAMGGLKEPKLDLSIKEEKGNLIFSVRDYGIGLSDEDYEKCFQMYYSTKSQMGVGLNLVQSIIQSNEGSIEFSSPEGGGLELRICLPLKCFLKNHFKKDGERLIK